MKPQIVKSFLNAMELKRLKDTICSFYFPWFYQASVADEKKKEKETFYFTHMFYFGEKRCSQYYHAIEPLLNKLNIKTLIRAKANFYPNQGHQYIHPPHIDFSYKHSGCLFSVNTTNGFTRFVDGTTVIGKENQAMFFDPSILHFSSTATDTKYRLNIQINYLKNEH
tara:strand:- start:810 stop:1310 length:501 start_codon:yes stop_codon:yes gene_type:complete